MRNKFTNETDDDNVIIDDNNDDDVVLLISTIIIMYLEYLFEHFSTYLILYLMT
jgi:hypothetical protein